MRTPMNFPSWEEIYKSMPVETMPWFCRELDHDLAVELKQRNLTTGTFLDIGTGPGTQAIELAKLGFTVTGTDISETAIRQAQVSKSPVTFVTDDIVHNTLTGPFNFIFDRGCFHMLEVSERPTYVRTVSDMLPNDGLFFLKCFSLRETNIVDGPFRYTPDEVRATFGSHFTIESIIETEYRGTLTPNPLALFAVMTKK